MRSDANKKLELYSMSRLTECRSALEGIVPQWVQPPPIESCFSIMMTLRPLFANCIAAPSPPGPLPITTTSNWRSLVFIQRSSWLYPFVLSSYSNEKPMCLADRKSTRLNSSYVRISYAVFCLKKKKYQNIVYINLIITKLLILKQLQCANLCFVLLTVVVLPSFVVSPHPQS